MNSCVGSWQRRLNGDLNLPENWKQIQRLTEQLNTKHRIELDLCRFDLRCGSGGVRDRSG